MTHESQEVGEAKWSQAGRVRAALEQRHGTLVHAHATTVVPVASQGVWRVSAVGVGVEAVSAAAGEVRGSTWPGGSGGIVHGPACVMQPPQAGISRHENTSKMSVRQESDAET